MKQRGVQAVSADLIMIMGTGLRRAAAIGYSGPI